MKKLLIAIVVCLTFNAHADMCADGSYVGGNCTLAPNGTYVGGGQATLAPNGSYVGGSTATLAPNGSYVGGANATLCPDGSYVGGSGGCNLQPNGHYTGN